VLLCGLKAERELGLCGTVATCYCRSMSRSPSRVVPAGLDEHSAGGGAHCLAIACGLRDGRLILIPRGRERDDPGFRWRWAKLPGLLVVGLCQPSRAYEAAGNGADDCASWWRMNADMIDMLLCSYPSRPKGVTLDIDDHCDVFSSAGYACNFILVNGHHRRTLLHALPASTTRLSRQAWSPICCRTRKTAGHRCAEVAGHIRRLVLHIQAAMAATTSTCTRCVRALTRWPLRVRPRSLLMVATRRQCVDYPLRLATTASPALVRESVNVSDACRGQTGEEAACGSANLCRNPYGAKSWNAKARVVARLRPEALLAWTSASVRHLAWAKARPSRHLTIALYCALAPAHVNAVRCT